MSVNGTPRKIARCCSTPRAIFFSRENGLIPSDGAQGEKLQINEEIQIQGED
jgi:hypothetical protein